MQDTRCCLRRKDILQGDPGDEGAQEQVEHGVAGRHLARAQQEQQ